MGNTTRTLPRALTLTPAGLKLAALADRFDRGDPPRNTTERLIYADWAAYDRLLGRPGKREP